MVVTRHEYAKRLLAMFERVPAARMNDSCPADKRFKIGTESLKEWNDSSKFVKSSAVHRGNCRLCLDFINLDPDEANEECPCTKLGVKKAVRRGNAALDRYFVKGTHKWLIRRGS